MLGATPSSHSLAAGAPSTPQLRHLPSSLASRASSFGQVGTLSLLTHLSATRHFSYFFFWVVRVSKVLPSRKIMCSSGQNWNTRRGVKRAGHTRACVSQGLVQHIQGSVGVSVCLVPF